MNCVSRHVFVIHMNVLNLTLKDLDVDPKLMNKETLEETGSFLLSGSLPQHCLYTRLSSVQKLKVHLKTSSTHHNLERFTIGL